MTTPAITASSPQPPKRFAPPPSAGAPSPPDRVSWSTGPAAEESGLVRAGKFALATGLMTGLAAVPVLGALWVHRPLTVMADLDASPPEW